MIGHSLEDLGLLGSQFAADAALASQAYQRAANPMVTTGVRKVQELAATKLAGKGGMTLARYAGHPIAMKALRFAPGLAAAGGVLGVADVIAGPDSFANKSMDTAAMAIGGVLGAAGGPLGAAAGAGLGKAASDAAQWLFGDKKSAEQRKLEQALLQLRGGQL